MALCLVPALHQHLERASHVAGVGELVDGVAFGAELPGITLDDLTNGRRTRFEKKMRLVGELHRLQP
jgi:hypothetical protein